MWLQGFQKPCALEASPSDFAADVANPERWQPSVCFPTVCWWLGVPPKRIFLSDCNCTVQILLTFSRPQICLSKYPEKLSSFRHFLLCMKGIWHLNQLDWLKQIEEIVYRCKSFMFTHGYKKFLDLMNDKYKLHSNWTQEDAATLRKLAK